MTRFQGRVVQDDVPVATVDAPTLPGMIRELSRYAVLYGQDGPVVLQVKENGRWKDME